MDLPGIPDRLRRVRRAFGYRTAKEFADFLGIGYKRYVNWENGHPIPINMGDLICAKCPGIDKLWLYDANPINLPLGLRRQLGERLPIQED